MIELVFPVLGSDLPVDHGYAAYSALAEPIPGLHNGMLVSISSISGSYIGAGKKQLTKHSTIRFRLDAEEIPVLLPLAGKSLNIAGHSVRLGVPRVQAIISAPALVARMVTIKGFTEPSPFLEAANRQLSELGIDADLAIPPITSGDHVGEPRRRVLRIQGKRIVGFSLLVQGLTASASLQLQEKGIGGRRKMGCGFFMPKR